MICVKGTACGYPTGCKIVSSQRSTQIPISSSNPASAASNAPAQVSDPLVASIQTLLAALGYDIGIPDGVVGAKTRAAIATFQQSLGEKADGQSSDALRAKLQQALAERSTKSAVPKAPTSTNEKKAVGSGTGFYVGEHTIVTNHHVIDGCSDVRIGKNGALIGSARLLAASDGDDLAALHSENSSVSPLKLRVGAPVKAAEAVLVFGYPLAGALSSSGNTTLGNVTALTGLKDDSRFIQISAAVQPGNSGGPVLDEAGWLVGIVEGKLDAVKVLRATGDIPQNVNFAIRASTLANFLEAHRIAYEAASNSTVLQNTQLAERAEAASVQLECWK